MLSYSLSFYLFRSRRDLWPLFFPPRLRPPAKYARIFEQSRYRARKWDLSSRIVATVRHLCKEHDKKHANSYRDKSLPLSILLSWFLINFQPLQVVPWWNLSAGIILILFYFKSKMQFLEEILISVIPNQFPISSNRFVIKLSARIILILFYFKIERVGKKRTPIVRDRTQSFFPQLTLFKLACFRNSRVGLFRICFIIFSSFHGFTFSSIDLRRILSAF